MTSPNAIPLGHTLTAFIMAEVVCARRFDHTELVRPDRAFHALLDLHVGRAPTRCAVYSIVFHSPVVSRRAYDQSAYVEQIIEELMNDPDTEDFCAPNFWAPDTTFLAGAYHFQPAEPIPAATQQSSPQTSYRREATMHTAVLCTEAFSTKRAQRGAASVGQS